MTSAVEATRSLASRLRRLGVHNTFYVKDAITEETQLRPAMVRLINSRLVVYTVTQGLTRVEQHGKMSFRGTNMMLNVYMGIDFVDGEQDTYNYLMIWWRPFPAMAKNDSKIFNSGYFPEDYSNALRYCQEMFDECLVLPSTTFTRFFQSGTRYYLDLEGEAQDEKDVPF